MPGVLYPGFKRGAKVCCLSVDGGIVNDHVLKLLIGPSLSTTATCYTVLREHRRGPICFSFLQAATQIAAPQGRTWR